MNEIADDINAKIAENVSKSVSYTKRKIAKKMKALKEPVEKIAEITGLTEDEVNALQVPNFGTEKKNALDRLRVSNANPELLKTMEQYMFDEMHAYDAIIAENK